MGPTLPSPTPAESQAIEGQIRADLIRIALPTILWGILTNAVWVAVDVALEPKHLLALEATRVGLATPLLLMWRAVRSRETLSARQADAFCLAMVGLFGLIGVPVALVDHYEVYVVGFSLVIFAAAVLIRWRWQIAAASYGLLLGEFLLAELLPGAQPSPALFLGSVVYLGTSAMLMTVQAALARSTERQSIFLSIRLEQRNRELNAAMTELNRTQARLVETEKLSALGRLLAGLSHEINNPINVICNTIGSVLSDAAVLSSAIDTVRMNASQAPLDAALVEKILPAHEQAEVANELREAIDDLGASAQRIRNIHSDLRMFVRGDSDEPVVTHLEPGIQSTVSMLKRTAPAGIQWELSEGPVPPVRVRPDQINQILFNLVQNAIDAMGSSGSVRIQATSTDRDVTVSVIDTGPGIPEETAPRIFEPFFTTKDVGKGTGLGLAICRELAIKNGGSLHLNPEHPSGARFDLRLPRADPTGERR